MAIDFDRLLMTAAERGGSDLHLKSGAPPILRIHGRLLPQADFVSLHCDLNPTSFHLIGPAELKLMKKSAYLINTSRGAVVDEAALVEALRADRLVERRIAAQRHQIRVARHRRFQRRCGCAARPSAQRDHRSV